MGKVERKVYNYNYQSMLFTQATAAGIQLENAIILSPEQYKKAKIPANNKRIMGWAKDNHVNISIGMQQSTSDFNCTLGLMMDDRVSDNTMSTNKKMLKRLGEELIKFIDDMSDGVDEANKDAETHEKLTALVDKFKNDVKELCGKDAMIDVKIFKIPDLAPDELAHILAKAFECHILAKEFGCHE